MSFINDFLKFQNFITKPPSQLILGNVVNHPVYNEISDEDITTQNNISVALHCFVSQTEFKVSDHYALSDSHVSFPTITVGSYPYSKYGLNSIDFLRNIAKPSPYGDIVKGVTLVNDDIRKCYQVTHDDLPKKSNIDNCFLQGLVGNISLNMYGCRPVKLVFNKINIYEKGGHFSKHKDTPKPGVIGTLVCFPDSLLDSKGFIGGDLVLKTGETELHYNTGIVAFYSNIDHWVEPVTSGVRITSTYYIMYDDITETLADIFTSCNIENRSLSMLQEVDTFGVCLAETYGQSEEGVKGDDIATVRALEPYFDLTYVPVVLKRDDSYDDDCYESTLVVVRCTPEDFDAYCNDEIRDDQELEKVNFYYVDLSQEDDIPGKLLMSHAQEYIEYVGNECQQGTVNNMYFNRVLIASKKV
jgi:hypothetical protein